VSNPVTRMSRVRCAVLRKAATAQAMKSLARPRHRTGCLFQQRLEPSIHRRHESAGTTALGRNHPLTPAPPDRRAIELGLGLPGAPRERPPADSGVAHQVFDRARMPMPSSTSDLDVGELMPMLQTGSGIATNQRVSSSRPQKPASSEDKTITPSIRSGPISSKIALCAAHPRSGSLSPAEDHEQVQIQPAAWLERAFWIWVPYPLRKSPCNRAVPNGLAAALMVLAGHPDELVTTATTLRLVGRSLPI